MAGKVTRNPSFLTRPLEVLSTSSQLKISNDANNYADISVAADGELVIGCTGTDADITLNTGASGLIRLGREDTVRGSFSFVEGGVIKFVGVSGYDIKLISAGAADVELESAQNIILDADGHVEFDGCGVGFDLVTPTYDATTTVVDFKTGNKQFFTFGSGNIVDFQFHFPATSGNFVCLIKQDGTGSRTITNYRAMDSAGNAAAGSSTVKFPGGSNPTLTTDANHVDIISIFWDADNELAYGVASLDFQF